MRRERSFSNGIGPTQYVVYLKPISFSSAIAVRLSVGLGSPFFFFKGGVHLRAILGMRPGPF